MANAEESASLIKKEKFPHVNFEMAQSIEHRRHWWMMDVTDGGCREFFIIDGDSMLAHFICNPNRNKLVAPRSDRSGKRNQPWPDFYSRLQTIWLIERFLLELVQRNCIFDIVFFECNSAVWIVENNDEPATCRALTMRKILIEHLRRYFPKTNKEEQQMGGQLHLFADCTSKEWKDYFEKTGPRLVLMAIGICEEMPTEQWHRQTNVWKTMALNFLNSGVCAVARFDDLHFKGNRVMAYIANASTYQRFAANRKKVNAANIECIFAKFREQVEQAKKPSLLSESDSLRASTGSGLLVASLRHFMSQEEVEDEMLRFHFCIYLCLQHAVAMTLPLKIRAAISSTHSYLVNDEKAMTNLKGLIRKFYTAIYHILDPLDLSQGERHSAKNDDLANFFDETFVITLLTELKEISSRSPQIALKDIVSSECYKIALELCRQTFPDRHSSVEQLENFLLCDLVRQQSLTKEFCQQIFQSDETCLNGTPTFSNAVFDEILAPVLTKSLDETEPAGSSQPLVKYMELQHWHGHDKLESGKATKQIQRAQSTSTPRRAASGCGGDGNVKTAWRSLMRKVEKEQAIDSKLKLVNSALDDRDSALMKDVLKSTSLRLQKLELLEKSLCQEFRTGNYANGCSVKINMLDTVKEALAHLPSDHAMRREASTILANCLRRFGFNKCADSVAQQENVVHFTYFTFNPSLEEQEFFKELALHSDPEFQMLFCGHLFDRLTADCRADPRVSFVPDTWQRELLDVVDKNESALVCAPTSSGKTFISFYAMEQVLNSKEDGALLVYVSPTKAVVNQVAKEVKSRFPEHLEEIGVYTRDFRLRQFDCKILICVPQILEILLLSPTLCENWVPRLKRIIFDEVHTMGEKDGGVVWEHLLLMTPCPILALSASIANFAQIYEWLENIQRRKGIAMHMINTTRRYCELQKWIYAPRERAHNVAERKDGNEGHSGKSMSTAYKNKEATGNMVRVNPCAGILPSLIEYSGFPSNFRLMPDECLEIYKELRKTCLDTNVQPTYSLKQLDPNTFFGNSSFLTRDDSERYEDQLKTVIMEWIRDRDIQSGSAFSRSTVVASVANKLNEKIATLAHGQLDKLLGQDKIEAEFPRLLRNLASQDFLPAIVFCLDRDGCVALAKSAVDSIEALRLESNAAFSPRGRERKFSLAESAADESKLTKAIRYLGVLQKTTLFTSFS